MKFNGLVIKESLTETNILDSLNITKKEVWNAGNAELGQPKIWNTFFIEGPKKDASLVAERLSKVLKTPGWYTNLSTSNEVFVIFPNKVFRYSKGDKQKRQEVTEYARQTGIPESQLDWGE